MCCGLRGQKSLAISGIAEAFHLAPIKRNIRNPRYAKDSFYSVWKKTSTMVDSIFQQSSGISEIMTSSGADNCVHATIQQYYDNKGRLDLEIIQKKLDKDESGVNVLRNKEVIGIM